MQAGLGLLNTSMAQPSESSLFLYALRKAKEESLKEGKEQKEGRNRLLKRIAPFNLFINGDTDAEGDCQFDSAADQLRLLGAEHGHSNITKEQVREATIAWLRAHPDHRISSEPDNLDTLSSWVRDTQGTSWEDYLSRMARPREWGDEITLQGIVEAFRVQILLLSSTVADNYYSLHKPKGAEQGSCPTLWMCHFLEVHYGSLLSRLEYDTRATAKRRRLVELLEAVPVEARLDGVCDVVILDNAAAVHGLLERPQLVEIFAQENSRVEATLQAVEALLSKEQRLEVPLHRVLRYGELYPGNRDAELQREFAKALALMQNLREENGLLQGGVSQPQKTLQKEGSVKWESMVDEDGTRWLKVLYTLPQSEPGQMMELERCAHFGQRAKSVARLPLPAAVSGVMLFPFPSTIGHYKLAHSSKGCTLWSSPEFLPRPRVELTIAAVSTKAVEVEWSMSDASVATSRDWIALYTPEETNLGNYLCYAAVKPSSNRVSLSFSTKTPPTQFIVRFFCGENKWYPVCEAAHE